MLSAEKNKSSLSFEQKLDLVCALINHRMTYVMVSQRTGISVSTLENWVRNIRSNGDLIFRKDLLIKEKQQIYELRVQNKRLLMNHEQLNDEVLTLSEVVQQSIHAKQRKSLLQEHLFQADGSVSRWARLYGVPLSSLYYYPVAKHSEEYLIKRIMDQIHTAHLSWGVVKIWRSVQRQYPDISRAMITRYMEDMEMQPVCPTSRPVPRSIKHEIYPYCIDKRKLTSPDQAWTADISWIPIGRSFVYLAVVIDWFSRMIVGWALSQKADHRLVIAALQDAFLMGTPEILNSDQGSVYMSDAYDQFIRQIADQRGASIRRSVDGKGAWRDNIIVERWFRSIKYELLYMNEYDSFYALYDDIKRYIHWYNHDRRHMSLQDQTPASVYWTRCS